MIHEKIELQIDYSKGALETPAKKATLTTYGWNNLAKYDEGKSYPAIVICPGGGYNNISDRESEMIALKFASIGYQAFVLTYSITTAKFPTQLLELSEAVGMVRKNAEVYKVNPNKIFVCGFSAGGHLAASLGVYWNADFIKNVLGFQSEENKPNGLILCYPVIMGGEFAHKGSFHVLTGGSNDQAALDKVSLEKHIGSHTPPCFIWHTFEDKSVPVENALAFATGLRKNNISFDLHIYSKGIHGISLANQLTSIKEEQIVEQCQNWVELAHNWVKTLG